MMSMHAARLFDTVDTRDERMIQRREDERFAAEARQPFRIANHFAGEYLDCDIAVKRRIARAIHFTQPASADQRQDSKAPRRAPGASTTIVRIIQRRIGIGPSRGWTLTPRR
jgi:hypothetical protein